LIRLYRAPWSTNVERISLALARKGLEVESVVIDYSDRSPVERISGQGLVPVIEADGEVVADSARILERLEARYPRPALFPENPARRAEMDMFIEWFEEVWKAPPNQIEAGGDPAVLGARMDAWLDLFERMLDGRDHLFGDELSAADCIAFPFLKFAAGRDPEDDELFHRILDEHQSVEGRPRLAAWIERVDARPRAY
jgi:glutathione S-transferase